MTQMLPTEARWATEEEREMVIRELRENDGKNFTGQESIGYIVELDLIYPDSVKLKLKK